MGDEPTALEALSISDAKDRLSEVMTSVVHEHAPRVVSRRRGKETMLLMRAEDLAEVLEPFKFEPRAIVDGGEVTVELPPFDVLGFGETIDEAMEDLLVELRAYAHDFFNRAAFYMETDRASQAPWLLRFALTPEDRQLELLYADMPESTPAREAA